MMIVATDSGALIGCKTKHTHKFTVHRCSLLSNRTFPAYIFEFENVPPSLSFGWHFFLGGRRFVFGASQSCGPPVNLLLGLKGDTTDTNPLKLIYLLAEDRVNENRTCFPPPLLGGMLEETSGPEGPPLLVFPVQLLQRISPWFPFFHIGEEFVLQTAQHGFKPSGIVNNRDATQRTTKPTWICSMENIVQLLLTRNTMKSQRQKHMKRRGDLISMTDEL